MFDKENPSLSAKDALSLLRAPLAPEGQPDSPSTLQAHEAAVTGCASVPGGLYWMTTGNDGRPRLWDVESKRNMMITKWSNKHKTVVSRENKSLRSYTGHTKVVKNKKLGRI
mgnify:CR=1 FL=1